MNNQRGLALSLGLQVSEPVAFGHVATNQFPKLVVGKESKLAGLVVGTLAALATFFFFRDRVSLYSPGCPGSQFVDQGSLDLRNLPAYAYQVVKLKACATTIRPRKEF